MAVVAAAGAPGTALGGSREAAWFRQTNATITRPAIPGTDLGIGYATGTRMTMKSRVILNGFGGGGLVTEIVHGGRRLEQMGCNLAELLATVISEGDYQECANARSQRRIFVDLSLVPRRVRDEIANPPFGPAGAAVDDLGSREQAIGRAIRKQSRLIENDQPEAGRPLAKAEAVLDLLANPLATRNTRRILISSLESQTGFDAEKGVTDPAGRSADVLARIEPAHAKRFQIEASGEIRSFDLRSTTSMEHLIYYNAKSFDLLANRYELTATDLPTLDEWLAANGGREPIETQIFRPRHRVRRIDFAQHRVSCKAAGFTDLSPSHVCIDLGPRGPKGGYVVVGTR